MKLSDLFKIIIPALLSPAAAYLAMPQDSCEVSLTFCIEATALADADSLEKTRLLLKDIYGYATANLNFHFVPSAAFVYGYDSDSHAIETEKLFEHTSFFLSEDFAAALENVPMKDEARTVFAEDAQRGAEKCAERATEIGAPYGANNLIAVVSKHFVNATRLNEMGLPAEWVPVVAAEGGRVAGFFGEVCGGEAVNTCGAPAMFFGVDRGLCSGYLAQDSCVLMCPAPYSTEKRTIRCVLGAGWVISERCRETIDWLTIFLTILLALLSVIPFAVNVRYAIKTTRKPASARAGSNDSEDEQDLLDDESAQTPPSSIEKVYDVEMLLYDN